MQLTVLGSGTVAPTPDRTAAAHWVEAGDVRLLLDCGAGTLLRATQFGVPWHAVTHVAISHFHVDHWGELPHYLFALRWGIEPPRTERLVLIGPRGLRARLTLAAGAFEDWLVDPPYRLEIVELRAGATYPLGVNVTLECAATRHTPESLAYAVRSEGARLVYTGDTGFDTALADWARGCDVLLAECSLPDDRGMDMHLTPTAAARLATLAGARHLLLTHFYPVFGPDDPADLARARFDGTVTPARDGDRFTIPTV